jgi:endonuclease YncB( thermonuclease family)
MRSRKGACAALLVPDCLRICAALQFRSNTFVASMRLVLMLSVVLLAFTPARADDANTLTVDGTVYRLDGVDAPELDQYCVDTGGPYPCGLFALEALQELIGNRRVVCRDLGPDPEFPQRRIGNCGVAGVDIQHWLVRQGWAVNVDPLDRFADDEREARERPRSIWRGCFVAPQDFRQGRKLGATLLGASCAPDARAKLFADYTLKPPGCEIKGKYVFRAHLTGHRGVYHVPGCGSYRRTANPHRWFCSEWDAVAAGFRPSLTCWLH